MKSPFSTRTQRGFTLLELLVVISILGILMAMSVAAFSTAQKKGRDAKRRGDMKSIQSAMEQYKTQASDGLYVNCSSLGATFLPGGVPDDPKGDVYPTCAATGGGTGYCACALLENEGTGNSDAACSSLGSAGDYYCVTNLQ